MLARGLVVLVVLAGIAAGCGLTTSNDTDKDVGLSVDLTEEPVPSPQVEVEGVTPSVTEEPTPSVVEQPTPLAVPSPTPTVDDSFVTLVSDVRNVFTRSDKVSLISALISPPVALIIPEDAELQSFELDYERWDLWRSITANFAPVDRAASMVLRYQFLTSTTIDDIRQGYRDSLTAEGFDVDLDDSEEGVFADTQYILNGGFLRPGLGGTARLIAIRQGDRVLVEFDFATELDVDSQPGLTQWPEMFPVPFSGGFTKFTLRSVAGANGIEVSSTGIWTLSATLTDRPLALETLKQSYPTATVSLDDPIVSTGENSVAVTTFLHPTGATGNILVDEFLDASVFEFRLVSQPG